LTKSSKLSELDETKVCEKEVCEKISLCDLQQMNKDFKSISTEEDKDQSSMIKPHTSIVQPDIVVSTILERPSTLPGIINSPTKSSTSTETSKSPVDSLSTPLQQVVTSKPKRPPPPKPRHQPKRPPPIRPSTGSTDVQTPNTTVDNITKEFVTNLSRNSSPCHTGSLKCSTRSNSEKLKSSSEGSSIKSARSPLVTSPSLSAFDEVQPWSKLTKNTVLRIDTIPALEILSTVIVKNLDTGQTMPLSAAAEKVSQYLNPLSLQIMSRTKEFNCPTESTAGPEIDPTILPTCPQTTSGASTLPTKTASNIQDVETASLASDDVTIGGEATILPSGSNREKSKKLQHKYKQFQSFLSGKAKHVKVIGKIQVDKAVQKVRNTKTASGDGAPPGGESLNVSSDEDFDQTSVKFKASSSNKGPYQFGKLKLVQDINVHVGAVWSMKFSHCGRLLATAGQNNIIWVWVLKEYFAYFNELRTKYENKERGAVFATPPRSMNEGEDENKNEGKTSRSYSEPEPLDEEEDAPFRSLPFTSYVGHSADVLDLAWSKNYFTLSSSMDKTVRLWHVSQKECLCCFQHIDFVTAIAFHPKDDRYFLSGSLDGKLRFWNIPEKKVALWNEVTPDSSNNSSSNDNVCLITSVNFCENGKYAVCGTYDGRCLFYNTEHLKYWTQIHVRSSRRRNSKGHKITGVEPLPSEHKVLITSNDSRVRLYDLRDLTLSCKYKGLTNTSSQIKASFSQDCKYIICGSEDKSLYIWPTHLSQDLTKISSLRRDRNEMWESIRSHDAVVTCAIFAPFPHLVTSLSSSKQSDDCHRQVIVSADFDGVIKVFMTG